MPMEELLRTTCFICTVDFWRMAIFWPLLLVMSYLLMFAHILMRHGKPKSLEPCKTHFFASAALRKPICVITGVILNTSFLIETVLTKYIVALLIYQYLRKKNLLFDWQATSGVGAASARALAREGFFVVLGTSLPLVYILVRSSMYQLPCYTELNTDSLLRSGYSAKGSFTALTDRVCDSHIVIVGRSKALLNETMMEIRKENKDAQLEAFEADLSSFSSISKFKASFEQWLQNAGMHSSVQLLINNAGILATSCRRTGDGLEEMIATNYVGAFCLTKFMLPFLVNSPVPSRIVNVTSFTHRNVNDMQIKKEYITGKHLFTSQQYPFARVYEYSKVCLLLFTYSLHQQLSSEDQTRHVSVNAADPGSVETNLMREFPSYISLLAFTALKLFGLLQSPKNGARSVLDASFAPPDCSGEYFFGGNGATINSSVLSRNVSLGERLWKTSSDIFLELKLTSSGTSLHGE